MLTITKPGHELTPIELGHFHAWVMSVQAKINDSYQWLDVLAFEGRLEYEEAELVAEKLYRIQVELDDVAWLIDDESWAAFDPNEYNGYGIEVR